MKAGKLAAEKTTVEVNPAFDLGTESTITVTAKDQYGNPVKGEQFHTDVTIVNNDGKQMKNIRLQDMFIKKALKI